MPKTVLLDIICRLLGSNLQGDTQQIGIASRSHTLRGNFVSRKEIAMKIIMLVLAIALSSYGCSDESSHEAKTRELFPILLNGKIGYIDIKGKIAIDPQFAPVNTILNLVPELPDFFEFSEGRAMACPLKDGPGGYGYIDKKGKMVIENRFASVDFFSEGLAVVSLEREGALYGYIDKSGKMVIKPQFEIALPFREGLALVTKDKNDMFWIDKKGKTIIKVQKPKPTPDGRAPIYSSPFPFRDHFLMRWPTDLAFSGGLAPAFTDGKWLFIDKTGSKAIDVLFDDVRNFSEDLAAARSRGFWGYIDRKGKTVIEFRYLNALNFSEGLAGVETRGGWGFIDKTGKMIVGGGWAEVRSFSEGFAAIRRGRYWYFIDKGGKTIPQTAPGFDGPSYFSGGLASVVVHEKVGYIDKTGNYVWNPSK
jgi:hypothetical protein